MKAWTAAILSVVLGGLAVPAQAQENSRERVSAFAALPDWSGRWVQDAVEWGLNGRTGQNRRKFKFAGHPPYNAEWEKRYQDGLAGGDVAEKNCYFGFPAMMEGPQPFEILVTPEETMISAANSVTRRIYTDGRAHLSKDELFPTEVGDSVGRWEGDTLVVDTIGRRAGAIWILGSILSDAAHFTERLRRTALDRFENQMTIEDPVAFTEPWRVTIEYRRETYPDRIIPYDCDNDRIEIEDGKISILPKP